MTLEELIQQIKDLHSEKKADYELADGADSNFAYLEGFVDCLDHLLGLINAEGDK